MMIAHLPASYLASCVAARFGAVPAFCLGMVIGGVAPDLDMLWFLFVDHGTVHHHHYLTHRPVLWCLPVLAGLLLRKPLLSGFGLGGLLHVGLDTIVGSIAWLWPLSTKATPLVVVPAKHDHWVLSFLDHWTFGVEICLTALALAVYQQRRKA